MAQDEVTQPRFRFTPKRAGEALLKGVQPQRAPLASWPRPRGSADDLHHRRRELARVMPLRAAVGARSR